MIKYGERNICSSPAIDGNFDVMLIKMCSILFFFLHKNWKKNPRLLFDHEH